MKIYQHIPTGEIIASDSKHGSEYEIESLMDAQSWATCDCEDISTHPVISRQLRRVLKLDSNGFAELTDKPFSASDLASAVESLEKADSENSVPVIRDFTSQDFATHALDIADFPNDTVRLATWPDRSGWFCVAKDPANEPSAPSYYCAVFNESDCFFTESECLAWLFGRIGPHKDDV